MMKSFVTSCTIATCAIVFVVLSMACTAQAELIGHWKFDGNFNDSVGSNNASKPTPPDGTNDASAGTTDGKIGGAVSFDGVQDALTVPQAVFSLTDYTYSFSFWEYATDVSGANTGYFMASGTDSGGYNIMYFRRYKSLGILADDYAGSFVSTPDFGDIAGYDRAEWHHHLMVLDGKDGNSKWYIDGVYKASDTSTYSGSVADLWLGNRKDFGRDYDGKIDDLQIYSGLLDGDDASYLHSNPGAVIPEPSTLVLLVVGGAVGLLLLWRRQR